MVAHILFLNNAQLVTMVPLIKKDITKELSTPKKNLVMTNSLMQEQYDENMTSLIKNEMIMLQWMLVYGRT
jgi:hypothetical protein